MALAMKSQSQLSQVFSGLQVPDSAYGQAVPYVWGHCRIPHRLIYWGNFQSAQQGGKKGGKGGGETVYTTNADLLLGYGPFEGIGSVWANQTWQYVEYNSATFTGSGTATSFTFTISPTNTFIMVMGVQLEVTFSVSFSDYGGYGITRSSTESGSSWLPLYNGGTGFPAPNYGTFATPSSPYAEYNTTFGSESVTVVFPSAVTNPTVRIYWIENGGQDQPLNSNAGKKSGGGIPVQVPGLTFEPQLGDGPSGNPQVFEEFSGVGGANIPLGPSPVIPYLNYEVKALFGLGNSAPVATYDPSGATYTPQTTSGDCCPADIVADIVCSGNRYNYSTGVMWNHGLGFSMYSPSANAAYAYSRYGGILADEPDTWAGGSNLGINAMRDYCMAYGIFISGSLDSQRSAADFLAELCKVANTAPVWNGASLDFIPYCEVSAYGNGTEYIAPTASGPLFELTTDDFEPQEDKSGLMASIDRPSPNYNSLQIGYKDATQQFNDNYVIISDSMDIMVQGPMPGPQETYSYITSPAIAQSVGWARLRRMLTVDRKEYKFSLPTYWEVILTPMDLITVEDSTISASPIPVRIKSIEISVDKNGKRKMDLTAEPFMYGASSPLAPTAAGTPQSSSGPGTGGSVAPGNVNTPIFIETVPALNPAGPQLWICVSSSSLSYGGCAIWMSLDGGSTYGSQPIGVVRGSQTMGLVFNTNYPTHADPDNTDTLQVNLTESLGSLTSVSSSAQNTFWPSLWYLSGGGTLIVNGQTLTIPYELGAFQTATLISANEYALGPPNRRGVFNTPITTHNIGSGFSYLSDGLVFKMNLSQSMIGVTLYFKFTAFNTTGGNEEELSSVTAYPFTPTGLVGWTYNSGGTGGTTPTGTPPADFANDLYMYVPGKYTAASQEIWSAEPARPVTLPAGLTDSVASCDAAPTASSISLVINKVSGGVATAVGTVNFTSGSTVGTFTFSSAVTLNGTGDYLQVMSPSSVDATLSGVRVTFWATRSS